MIDESFQNIEQNKDQPFFLYYPMLLSHDEHNTTGDPKSNRLFDYLDAATNNKNGHSGDDEKYFPDMIPDMDKLIGRGLINSMNWNFGRIR